MKIEIQPFLPDHYPVMAEIFNGYETRAPHTAEDFQNGDRSSDPRCLNRRWVFTEKGQVIAFAHYRQFAHEYDPQYFRVFIAVRKDQQRRGIGSKLWEHLQNELTPHRPTRLRCSIYANQTQSIKFVE